MGLDYEEIANRSPFELSGGQKRRVAIAGVIAMEPKVLVLDEPIAGLDPQGKKDIMKLIMRLKQTVSPTIIMVSHDMDIVAKYATKVAVFNEGTIKYCENPQKLFEKEDDLRQMGLDTPIAYKVASLLRKKGMDIDKNIITPEALVEEIVRLKGEQDA